MGKKSLTKSTTKKKAKKSTKKKTVETPVNNVDIDQNLSEDLNAYENPLLHRRFDVWNPEKPWKPKPDKSYEKNFSAPPTVTAKGKEAKRIRSLLSMDIGLASMAAAEQKVKAPESKKVASEKQADAPAKTAEKGKKKAPAKPKDSPKKKPTLKELIGQRFPAWQPEKPYAPETTGEYEKSFAAPPAFENVDPALIRRQFDLSAPVETVAAQQPVETAEPVETPPAEMPEPAEASEDVIPPEAPAKTPEPETVQPEPSAENATYTKEPIETAETESTMEQITATKTDEEVAADKPEPDTATQPAAAEPPAREVVQEEPETPKEATGGPGGGGFGGNGGDGGDGPGIPPREPKEPLLGTGTKILIASLALVFLILIGTSISNSKRYVLHETHQGVEIWRGDFSPRGTHKIALLPTAEIPGIEKPAYTREEAFAFAYDHFMNSAIAMMEDDEVPIDMRGIRNNLENAREYAKTPGQRRVVDNNLKQLDFAMFIYRADVAAAKQTREGYKNALEFLNRATALDIDSPGRIAMIKAKTERIQNDLKALGEEPAETEVPEEDPVEEEPLNDTPEAEEITEEN